jgi:acyl-coenzyme A synthetase/AMP-(fatty) acid ligase
LLAHPCIVGAAFIGCLRANGVTEVPRLTAEEIYTFVAERLASYRPLDCSIVFVDEIPRTASGKIQRFKLAQMDQFRNSITELLMRNDDAVKG